MRKFKRAAVAAAGVLAFTGIAVGSAQAADLQVIITPGNAATDCHTAGTQQELDRVMGRHVTIDHCQDEGSGTMSIWYY
ncbi:hypothetical protein ACF1DY_29180 [Streptomyces albus]|uniref:hypothetical protein n=1 Tax=Streptomyces albus TaxID=1888 RepID=UPI003701407D